jgi:hypothetical protein
MYSKNEPILKRQVKPCQNNNHRNTDPADQIKIKFVFFADKRLKNYNGKEKGGEQQSIDYRDKSKLSGKRIKPVRRRCRETKPQCYAPHQEEDQIKYNGNRIWPQTSEKLSHACFLNSVSKIIPQKHFININRKLEQKL